MSGHGRVLSHNVAHTTTVPHSGVKAQLKRKEREREREKRERGFHVAFPKCSAVICRCGGLHSCCGKRARAFKSRSSTFAVGPMSLDTVIIASDTSLFAVFTTDVKSIVVFVEFVDHCVAQPTMHR